MITKVINVNLHQPIYERLTAKQGDIASRYLLFHLLDGDKPFDLTGKSVRVYARKPDKTEIFNDLTINDASKGYCTLELTSQCLASAGVVKMELYISESGKVLTSIPFELEVIACINTANGVTSTNEFSALEAALSSLQDYDNLRREIVQARKGHATVGGRLDNFDSQLDNIAYNFDVDFPRLDGERSDNARFKRAITTLKHGDKLLFDNKIYEFDTEKIIINKQITIEGKKKPLFNGTNLVNGTVLKSVGFVIEENNITIKNLGLDSPDVDNTFQANTKSVFNILIENCSAVAYAHSYLFESYNGTVYNVLVDKCDSYKSIHGFISKAMNVTFSNCKACAQRSYGFGNIADNILTSNANNRNNRVINCYADSCGTGFVCYSRDTKSDNNANEIYLKELVWYGNYAYDCAYGYVIGDINESPAGQTYNKVINVLMTDCQEQGGENSYSLAIGRTSRCKVTNSTFSVGVIYKSEYTPDCIIEPAGIVQLDYPQKHQDITITNSTLTFQTCDLNPILSVSCANYQEISKISCNLTNIQTLTIKLSDNNVCLKSGADGLTLGRTYYNKDSFVVLKKNRNGKWYELYGYTSFTG